MCLSCYPPIILAPYTMRCGPRELTLRYERLKCYYCCCCCSCRQSYIHVCWFLVFHDEPPHLLLCFQPKDSPGYAGSQITLTVLSARPAGTDEVGSVYFTTYCPVLVAPLMTVAARLNVLCYPASTFTLCADQNEWCWQYCGPPPDCLV